MFYTLIELSIGIRVGSLVVVSLPKYDPRPLSYGKGYVELWFKCL